MVLRNLTRHAHRNGDDSDFDYEFLLTLPLYSFLIHCKRSSSKSNGWRWWRCLTCWCLHFPCWLFFWDTTEGHNPPWRKLKMLSRKESARASIKESEMYKLKFLRHLSCRAKSRKCSGTFSQKQPKRVRVKKGQRYVEITVEMKVL